MAPSPSLAEVERALDQPRALLAADDFDLVVRPSSAGFDLEIVATEGACADCLVPEPLFRGIVADALAAHGVVLGADGLTVTYPSPEGNDDDGH
jgi:hypothetical protein